jgi:drug/metabolite transporter (DMT)-like permease
VIYLLFSILCSTSIVLIFKKIDLKGINTFNVIIINYLTALGLGFLLSRLSPNFSTSIQTEWLLPAAIIGIAFVAMFYIIALTSQKAGASVAAISSRTSVVIPVLFSILYYGETLGIMKIAGISLALPALILSSLKEKNHNVDTRYLYLPFMLFIGSGIVDSIVKYAQQEYLNNSSIMIFSAVLFSVAFSLGIVVRLISKEKIGGVFNKKVIAWGILLGAVNWGSLYFFVMALINTGLDSSVVFIINNSGIVLLITVFAIILFREKLSRLNWTGLALSLLVIYFLSRSQ